MEDITYWNCHLKKIVRLANQKLTENQRQLITFSQIFSNLIRNNSIKDDNKKRLGVKMITLLENLRPHFSPLKPIKNCNVLMGNLSGNDKNKVFTLFL